MGVFETVADFERAAASMMAVTGFRLHGNLMALAPKWQGGATVDFNHWRGKCTTCVPPPLSPQATFWRGTPTIH